MPEYLPREESVLEEARSLVEGERAEAYQHPFDDHTALGLVWTGILQKHFGQSIPVIPAHVVSMMMVGVKVVREAGVHGRDNLVDIAGYAYCAQIEVAEGQRRGFRVNTGHPDDDPESVRSSAVSDDADAQGGLR